MRINVDIQVHQDMAELVRQQAAAVTRAALPAMVEEAEKIRTLSMEIVPVDQGILRNSAIEVGTNVEDRGEEGGSVTIGYGGAASSYALIQHETPPSVFSHAPGQSWKYLERPFLESAASVREALTEAVLRSLRGVPDSGSGETFE